MPLFSVIIPTYNHCDTIIWAIKSIQMQTIQDFEILVVGDGVPDRTRSIMEELCKSDLRIHFFDNPKGKAKGELHRHKAIMGASGKYIAYNGDDDIWHKSHLETLSRGLQKSDFCHTYHGCVFPSGKLTIFPGNIGNKFCRDVLLNFRYNFFGPTCAGHSRESYINLPEGWTPAPKGLWTDLHMWRQWFQAKEVNFLSIPRLTTIHLDSPGREAASVQQRADESKRWLAKIHQSEGILRFELEGLRRMALEQGCYHYMMRHYQSILEQQQG